MKNSQEAYDSSLLLTNYMQEQLISTAKWSKFLSILGFIVVALMILASFFFFINGTVFETISYFSTYIIGVLYLISALFYLYPIYHLFRFSQKTLIGIKNGNISDVEKALSHQKKMFKFLGIITLFMLFIYFVSILIFAFSNFLGY